MKKESKILIVDDNEETLLALGLCLKPHFDSIQTVKNPNLIPRLIESTTFDAILLDANFSADLNTGNEGLFWLQKILHSDPFASVILFTAYADIQLVVNAIKAGATDFIHKPWNEEQLIQSLKSACKTRRQKANEKDTSPPSKQTIDNSRKCHIIGQSAAIKNVLKTVNKVSGTDANVLILGEHGTGKELIARAIHQLSPRANKPFVRVDVASLSQSLLESELFGHKKGAFTDAHQERLGRFEIASGGTLFLDEIGNIPLNTQSKLLTALQNRQITPLGTNQASAIDIRLICATNASLHHLIQNDQFREDLLYRINTIQIESPPLRERIDDIPLLADYYLKKFAHKYKKPTPSYDLKALQKLQSHHWPGNIRELQHLMEKAVVLCDCNRLSENDFVFTSPPKAELKTPFTLNLSENERLLIIQAIKKTNGNLTHASHELGITRKTLYNKIKRYNL